MSAPCAGATLTVTVSGTDVSCDVVSVDLQRYRTRLWDPPSASDCQIVVNAGPGGQPYSRGPVGAIVTVVISYGSSATHTYFTGTVQQRQVESTPEATLLQLYAVDGFEQLSRVNRAAGLTDTAVGAGDTVDERIGRWLDEADYTGPRALTASTMTCPEVVMGLDEPNVLRNIMHTAQADGGDFFFNGSGTAIYLSWDWRNAQNTVDAVFSDRLAFDWVPYSSSVYRDDLDEVQNYVPGIRRKWDATDPIPQTADNPSSVSTYGQRGDALTDLELEDDTQVATRVAGVVQGAAFPSPRFDPVVIQPGFAPSRSWPRVLAVQYGSLVVVNRTFPTGTVAMFGHVIGFRLKITANDATVIFRISGTGTWDAFRVPRFPVAPKIDPVTGKICIPKGYPCDMTSEVVIKDVDGDILGTYPPGSLCYCEDGGGIDPIDGMTEVCLVNDFGEICSDLEDPKRRAVLWFDVLDPGPDLIEWIDGDPVDPLAGFSGTRLDVIPGGFEAIDATGDGGEIGGSHSDKVAGASFTGGWTIEFYFYRTAYWFYDTDVTIFNMGSMSVHLTDTDDPGDDPQFVVEVATADFVMHRSGPIGTPPAGGWHKLNIQWDPLETVTGELVMYIDGIET